MNRLALRYKFDRSYFDEKLPSDDFGWLSVIVETASFKGKSGFWVQWQDVAEFGESLDRYLIEQDSPISIQWGYNKQEGDDLIVRLQISTKDSRGALTASVEIADYDNNSQRLITSYRTTYAAVDLFKNDIAKLMKREIDETVLLGH
ncbi:MAG: hypothetical protein DI637_13355 [Citromicrobium sp.]|nr:MAG: hypothetical protein DI637_13355 [Citromicrobium sp.]